MSMQEDIEQLAQAQLRQPGGVAAAGACSAAAGLPAGPELIRAAVTDATAVEKEVEAISAMHMLGNLIKLADSLAYASLLKELAPLLPGLLLRAGASVQAAALGLLQQLVLRWVCGARTSACHHVQL